MVNSWNAIGNPLGTRFEWLHTKVDSDWKNARVIEDLAQAQKVELYCVDQ